VGPPGDDPARPNVVFLATYHAREWAATEMALRLLVFLADSLAARPGGAALLASRDVWVIPVVNPDGYQYTFTDQRLWRKNRRPTGGSSVGVDLNRNHAGFFAYDDEGSSPEPFSEVYRGPSAESEPETRAIAAFHRAHPPVIGIS
jgi:murein tripeptide amidase MpaA